MSLLYITNFIIACLKLKVELEPLLVHNNFQFSQFLFKNCESEN